MKVRVTLRKNTKKKRDYHINSFVQEEKEEQNGLDRGNLSLFKININCTQRIEA